jgi:hypothetical protein
MFVAYVDFFKWTYSEELAFFRLSLSQNFRMFIFRNYSNFYYILYVGSTLKLSGEFNILFLTVTSTQDIFGYMSLKYIQYDFTEISFCRM